MLNKIHTIQELKDTGLKIIGSYVSNCDIPIGEKYLTSEVINIWDCTDYSDYYTYFDEENIKFVVEICCRKSKITTKIQLLKKDLSNLVNICQKN